jgi:dTMP kinase
MARFKFYGQGLPEVDLESLTGRLIVLEGPDSVGRSTQTALLRDWLESRGHAVSYTGLSRSELTQEGLDQAKSGHTLGRKTMSLFYCTDFADRLENQIIPALRAGYYVLSDRYFYSICARDIVRGADREWLEGVYGFALVPDLTLYLRADVDDLVPRALYGKGFNYWESGMDLALGENLYDSFCVYQSRVIEQLDRMAERYNFVTIDASRDPQAIFRDLQQAIAPILPEKLGAASEE